MPFPFIPIIIVGVGALISRKIHDGVAEHPDLRGYCSNCGNTCNHRYHESGMSWKRTGFTGLLAGALGLGVSSLLARNIYKCSNCGHLVLACRTPGCTGMALSGKVYDDEFCGECFSSNDKSHFERAKNDRQEAEKLRLILVTMQQDRDKLDAKLRQLQSEHGADKQLINDLTECLKQKNREIDSLRERLAA